MGVLLFLVSYVLGFILIPVGLVFGFFKQVRKNTFRKAWRDIDNKFMSMAISRDKYGNVVCAELFNATLIKKSDRLFGSHRQTISHVIGLNLQTANLTRTGRVVNYILNKLHRDHAVKSIRD